MDKSCRITLVCFFIASIASVLIYYFVLGGLNIVPLARDAWQQIYNPFVKLRNVGRWANFIFYPFKHNVAPSLGLFLDGLSFAFLGYAILFPILRKIGHIYLFILICFWISTPSNLYFFGYPGGSTPVNLIAAGLLYSLHKVTKVKYRILVYAVSGILLFGVYESHYFIVFLPHILKTYVEGKSDVTVHLREFLIWVLGFILGYISWQLIHYGIYDKFIFPSINYRTLIKSGDGSFVEKAKLILSQISNAFKFFRSVHNPLINYSPHLAVLGLVITGLYTKSKIEKHVISLSLLPILGLMSLLILGNYKYFDRIGLVIWAFILVVVTISFLAKGRRKIIAILLIVSLSCFNLIKIRNIIGAQQKNISISIDTILTHIESNELLEDDILLIFGNANQNQGAVYTGLTGGIANQLGVKNVWKCKPNMGGNCKTALKKMTSKKSFCETNPEYLGKYSNLHVLKLNRVQALCKD